MQQLRASRLSVRTLCARNSLADPSFYAWRRVLQQRDADRLTCRPVQIVADPAPVQASALEVVLAKGRTMRVSVGLDAAALRQLLSVLEEEQPY